jgi:hypothetical protein
MSSLLSGRSQQLETQPSPNSKHWAPIFLWTHSFGTYILIGAEISTSALFLSYVAVILQFRTYLPLIFAPFILNFKHLPIFRKPAYILSKRQYFMQARIFKASSNILMIFAMSYCLIFVAASICVYFQYLFMHFCVCQYGDGPQRMFMNE